MSSGHRGKSTLTEGELNDLLAEALSNKKIKERLAGPYRLVSTFDIPLLGSSSIGGRKVFLDQHLRGGPKNGKSNFYPFGVIPIGNRDFDTKPPLVRHERLEQFCEDCLGWSYGISHQVATAWEHRWVKSKRIDPEAYENALRPFIKKDEHESINRIPTDLDLRPMMEPPADRKLLRRVHETAQKEKRSHERVSYEIVSDHKGQRCDGCVHFLKREFYGESGCEGVKSPIDPGGWCRRFMTGKMDG